MPASIFVGVSLDGFLARCDGGLDWLLEDSSEPHGFGAFLETVDVLVMGRNTFDIVAAFDAWPYGSKPVVVLSGRPVDLSAVPVPAEQMTGAPTEIVARLAARGMGRLYVDGGITIQEFLRAGLVDRLIVTRVPVLIGEGIPLFGPLPQDVRLDHIGTRSFPDGLVQSEYRVR